jgi:hypothetical protein
MKVAKWVGVMALLAVPFGGAVAEASAPPLSNSFHARIPAPPAQRGTVGRPPPVPHHVRPLPLTAIEERGVIAALGQSLGKTFHTDSYQMPFTMDLQTVQTTNDLIARGAWMLDMGGDTPNSGTTEHQVAAGFMMLTTTAGQAALVSGQGAMVELDVQVKNGTTYLFDCTADGEKAAFRTVQYTSSSSGVVDESVEAIQHGHLLLTYVAGSGDGWVQTRFTSVADSASNYTWWFSSCKVTPLSS